MTSLPVEVVADVASIPERPELHNPVAADADAVAEKRGPAMEELNRTYAQCS